MRVKWRAMQSVSYLQKNICNVVYDHDERSHSGEVAGPWEAEEWDGGQVVDEHLPKVFSLHVSELRDCQGPVERQLQHVVPPHVTLNDMVRIIVP